MKLDSFFKILFSFLAVFFIVFAGVFFVSDSEEVINIVSQNVEVEELNLKDFDFQILKWKLVIEEANFTKRDAHNIVVFKEKLWLFGGVGGVAPDYSKNYSDVWNSEDGINWTLITEKAPWGLRRAGEILVFKDKIWILGGVTKGERYANDVWSSEDGINWTLVTDHADWLPRKGFGSVVFNDKMWVMGGVAVYGAVNDVWSSEDGINWTLITDDASWYERYDLAVESFLGKMWLSGGALPGEMGAQEAWYSENGFNWEKTDKEIMWPGRHGHCFISYNNTLWVIGGWSGYAHGYNDTWYSNDGIIWNELYKDGSSSWAGREDLECIEFQNKIFMIGGMKTNGERTNDVWVLDKE